MAMPIGARRAVSQAAGWAVAAGCAAFSFTYLDEIKAVARAAFHLPDPAATASSQSGSKGGGIAVASGSRSVELHAGSGGHFHVRAEINGRPVDVLVDTGATHVALSYDDASRAGLHIRDRDFTQRVRTANGIARVAPVILDRVSIGPIVVRDVPASVSEPGALGVTLLGMSFLGRLERIDMQRGRLVLRD